MSLIQGLTDYSGAAVTWRNKNKQLAQTPSSDHAKFTKNGNIANWASHRTYLYHSTAGIQGFHDNQYIDDRRLQAFELLPNINAPLNTVQLLSESLGNPNPIAGSNQRIASIISEAGNPLSFAIVGNYPTLQYNRELGRAVSGNDPTSIQYSKALFSRLDGDTFMGAERQPSHTNNFPRNTRSTMHVNPSHFVTNMSAEEMKLRFGSVLGRSTIRNTDEINGPIPSDYAGSTDDTRYNRTLLRIVQGMTFNHPNIQNIRQRASLPLNNPNVDIVTGIVNNPITTPRTPVSNTGSSNRPNAFNPNQEVTSADPSFSTAVTTGSLNEQYVDNPGEYIDVRRPEYRQAVEGFASASSEEGVPADTFINSTISFLEEHIRRLSITNDPENIMNTIENVSVMNPFSIQTPSENINRINNMFRFTLSNFPQDEQLTPDERREKTINLLQTPLTFYRGIRKIANSTQSDLINDAVSSPIEPNRALMISDPSLPNSGLSDTAETAARNAQAIRIRDNIDPENGGISTPISLSSSRREFIDPSSFTTDQIYRAESEYQTNTRESLPYTPTSSGSMNTRSTSSNLNSLRRSNDAYLLSRLNQSINQDTIESGMRERSRAALSTQYTPNDDTIYLTPTGVVDLPSVVPQTGSDRVEQHISRRLDFLEASMRVYETTASTGINLGATRGPSNKRVRVAADADLSEAQRIAHTNTARALYPISTIQEAINEASLPSPSVTRSGRPFRNLSTLPKAVGRGGRRGPGGFGYEG